MVNRFDLKFTNLLKSVNGIENTIKDKTIDSLSINDKKSILYDFGGCEEQTWKLFKYYLEYIQGYDNLGNASKKIYRTLKELGVITNEELSLLLETINLRNCLFHEYNYDSIDESCEKILRYLDIFKRTLEIFNEIKGNTKMNLKMI